MHQQRDILVQENRQTRAQLLILNRGEVTELAGCLRELLLKVFKHLEVQDERGTLIACLSRSVNSAKLHSRFVHKLAQVYQVGLANVVGQDIRNTFVKPLSLLGFGEIFLHLESYLYQQFGEQ